MRERERSGGEESSAATPNLYPPLKTHPRQRRRQALHFVRHAFSQAQRALKDGAERGVADAAGVDADDAVLLQDAQGDAGEEDLGGMWRKQV